MENSNENFEKVLKKLRIKTKGENVLESIILKQVQQRKNNLVTFHRNVKVCMLMLEILKDYEYGLRNLIFEPHVPE